MNSLFVATLATVFLVPGAEEDRRMRARLTGAPVEVVQAGFLQLPMGPGLGISANELALAEYREREA